MKGIEIKWDFKPLIKALEQFLLLTQSPRIPHKLFRPFIKLFNDRKR
jgi:hypothetical protein